MKMRRMIKLMSVFLMAVLMLAAMSALPVFAETPAYSGGSGTADDPYLLSTPEDLVALSEAIANDDGSLDVADTCGLGMYHGYYFELTQDIDMTGVAWTPMSFCGNLDGKGFAIKNLGMVATDNGDGEYWTGLFAQLINATISNITFENCTATVDETIVSSRDIYASIVAANAIASKLEGVAVVGSKITQNGSAQNMAYAGFIAALADITNISGCSVDNGIMDIKAATTNPVNAGGITGCMEDMFYEYIFDYGNPYNMEIGAGNDYGIYDCTVDANITFDVGGGHAAGIVGMTCTDYLDVVTLVPERNGMGAEIKDCVFEGSITVTSTAGVASGISGWDEPEDVIDGCMNLGVLSAPTVYPLGELPTTVTNSYYIADAEDGNGGYTAAQFADGTVCTARGGHVVDADATCQDPSACALCGEEAGEHTAGTEYTFDATNHYLLCADCGETLTATAEAHDGAEACSVCGWINMTAEDLQMAINDLESAMADLETAMDTKDAELAGKIANLETAMTNAQNAITALQNNNTSGATEIELIKTAVSHLKDAQDTLQGAVDTLTQRLDQAIADIEELKENGGATGEQIQELILEVKLAQIAMEANYVANKAELASLVNTAIETLQGQVDDLTRRLNDAEGDIQTLLSDMSTAKDAIAALEEDYATKVQLSELRTALDSAVETLTAQINGVKGDLIQAKQDLQAAINQGDGQLSEKIEALVTALNDLETLLSADITALEGVVTDLAEEMAAADAVLTAAIATVQQNLDDAKTALETAIANGDQDLADKILALDAALKDAKATIATDIDDVQTTLEAAIAAVRDNLDAAKTALQEAMKQGDATLNGQIVDANAAIQKLEEALAAAKAALAVADGEQKEELEGVIASVQATLKQAMEAGDKANADALAKEVALLREEIAQVKKDAQVVPMVIACIAIVGDIVLLWVVILKRKRFMGMTVAAGADAQNAKK